MARECSWRKATGYGRRVARGPGLVSWVILWGCLFVGSSLLQTPPTAAADKPVLVLRVDGSEHYEALRHNIPNLRVTRDGQTFEARFLDTYVATGGVTRWGLPTSEVMEEEEGHLTQYYQRGLLDWHRSGTCGTSSGYCIERRLVWDLFGGGGGGSPDLGVEPGRTNPHEGRMVGPWGHKVSDRSIEGTVIGFRQFFERFGAEQSFGYPKTDARIDTNRPGTLYIDPARSGSEATPGFIRQYFQAGVMEFHAYDAVEPVKLRLLGDDLRNFVYRDEAWKAFRSFRNAAPLAAGSTHEPERVTPGPRAPEGRVIELHPITEFCSAISWEFRGPPQPPERYCGDDDFEPATLGLQLLTGDVLRTRNASPDLDVAAVVETIVEGVVDGIAVLATGVRALFGSIVIESGEAAIVTRPGSSLEVRTPDGVVVPGGAVVLVSVESGGTVIKAMEGTALVRSSRRPAAAPLSANLQTVLRAGRDPPAPSEIVLTSGDLERAQLLQQLKPRLGKPPGSLGPTCPTPLGSVSLNAQVDPGTNQVRLTWRSGGGCAPFKGTLTGQYAGEQTAYASHSISAAGGEIVDSPPSRCGRRTINYSLVLSDSTGRTVAGKAQAVVDLVC